MPEISLPDGVADAVVNRAQLARALAKSEPTIDRMIADGMPVLVEGTNGRSYEFQLSACYTWMVERDRAAQRTQQEADQAVDQLRLALLGGGRVGDDDERSLSPADRRELYEAERAFNLVASQRRQLVKRDDVVEALERVLIIMRDGLTSLPDRLERDAGLTGKALELAIDVCNTVLTETERAIDQQSRAADDLKQAAE